jgi:hypothetical protein
VSDRAIRDSFRPPQYRLPWPDKSVKYNLSMAVILGCFDTVMDAMSPYAGWREDMRQRCAEALKAAYDEYARIGRVMGALSSPCSDGCPKLPDGWATAPHWRYVEYPL